MKKELENLKKQLNNYTSDTVLARHYVALVKQMNDINQTLMSTDLIQIDSITENDEKTFERIVKLFERSKLMCETLVYLEERINPDLIRRASIDYGSDYEEILNDLNK